MEINEACEKILRQTHNNLEGKLNWGDFIAGETSGFNDDKVNELKGIYARALIILIDEGLCRKTAGVIVELAQKGIEYKGDFRKYLRKKKTTITLEKLRRIAPIVSAIIVIITFVITMLKRNANREKAAKEKVQMPVKPRERRR